MQLADLAPNPRNPRTISAEKLEALRASVKEFGSLDGVIFNRKTKRLVGGHQRRTLDPSAEITITTKYTKPTRTGTLAVGYVAIGGERFPYREVMWADAKERAANIAANKGAGEWNFPELALWMKGLEELEFDVDLTLFDDKERKKLFEHLPADEDDELDKVPDVPKTPRTKLGDMYELGRHRLLCGDATKPKDVRRLLGGDRVAMVFTDPPYGIGLETDWSSAKGIHAKGEGGGKYKQVRGDTFKDLIKFVEAIQSIPAKEIFCWGADYYAELIQNRNAGSWIVWDKCTKANGDVSAEGVIGSNFELCWSKRRHKRELARIMHKGLCSIEKEKRQHPTQKPVALAIWFLERYGKPNDIVCDLFGGSGSTLIACEKTDRHCVMMEIDPGYIDVTVERWEKLTGQKAERIRNAET